MEYGKEDRRTRRTRQLLRDAFLALLKEKRYEAISVQDVIERADVARSTFYAHYQDKQDLLVGKWGVFASNLDHQAERMSQEEESGSALSTRGWFRHIQAQGPILKVIARDPAMDLAMKTLQGILHHDIQTRIQERLLTGNDDLITPSIVTDFLTGTLLTLIQWWLKQDMSHTPERMDEIFQRLAMSGVSSMLNP